MKSLAVCAATLSMIAVVVRGQVKDLEDRVSRLERLYQACCTTQYKPWGVDADLELVVELRRKVRNLEERVEELEADK